MLGVDGSRQHPIAWLNRLGRRYRTRGAKSFFVLLISREGAGHVRRTVINSLASIASSVRCEGLRGTVVLTRVKGRAPGGATSGVTEVNRSFVRGVEFFCRGLEGVSGRDGVDAVWLGKIRSVRFLCRPAHGEIFTGEALKTR